MANKDLVKRAFSVTANLPPAGSVVPSETSEKAAEEGAEPAQVVELPALTPRTNEAPRPIAPKTGPGSMLAFMTDQSEVHREVVRLRERLNDFDGASATRKLDPRQVLPSKWANRDESHFATASFERLKNEIQSAGGNIQPIKVRPLPAQHEGHPAWEIVYGHRRHRACLELGLPVLALIEPAMKDAELFVEMERENREREDLSAWEQGIMYMRALEMGLFPSAKQLAVAIDRDMGNISKAMALAKLPADVVSAFGSPLNLQFRWATALKDAHQRDPETLINTARELAGRTPAPAPAEVFALLTSGGAGNSPAKLQPMTWSNDKGAKAAVLTFDRRGRATLSFEQPLDDVQRRRLMKMVETFMTQKA